MDTRVAKRYAKALYRAASKLEIVQSVEDDLTAIKNLVANAADFRGFLYSPQFGREDKIRIAERLFSDRITSLSMSALRLMIEKRRENELEGVLEEFVKLRREYGNVLFATVTTAMPMEEDLRQRLKTRLETVSGKAVEIEYKVDPNLMGGIRVAYGNFVLDGSMRGGLNRLRNQLRYDLLKQN